MERFTFDVQRHEALKKLLAMGRIDAHKQTVQEINSLGERFVFGIHKSCAMMFESIVSL